MSQNETLEIEVVVGEDFAAQIAWTDEDGNAVPVVAPCRLEVRDMANNLVMQISAPRAITTALKPGRYLFDLFAVTTPSPAPFTSQEVQVINGWFLVSPRVTIMEVAAL